MSFPLFAALLAADFLRTTNLRAYGLRLLLLGVR